MLNTCQTKVIGHDVFAVKYSMSSADPSAKLHKDHQYYDYLEALGPSKALSCFGTATFDTMIVNISRAVFAGRADKKRTKKRNMLKESRLFVGWTPYDISG
jgi:hypothetical protein